MASTSHIDLSDRLDPMSVKELRQCLRRSSFVYPFLLIHLFATAAIFSEFKLGMTSGHASSHAVMWNFSSFSSFWWVAMWVCGLLMPLAGLLLMPQEIEDGNHEILLLTRLTRWRIVFGKFITLWGICLLTFTSLFPYIIIRYFIGGIEWPQELANSFTVLSTSAIISATSIAASGFKSLAAKIGVFTLFFFSAAAGGTLSMLGSTVWLHSSSTSKWAIPANILFHTCSLITTICYSLLGMFIARSRLRIAILNYEMKPSSVVLIVVGLAPFIIGMSAAVTCGFGSILGTLLITYLAWNSDISPKAPKSMPPPPPNIPSPPEQTTTP